MVVKLIDIMTQRRNGEITDEGAIQLLISIGESQSSAAELLTAQDRILAPDILFTDDLGNVTAGPPNK